MTRTDFQQVLIEIHQHGAYTGCPFQTANIVEKLTGDNTFNQALSYALLEDWIEEA